MTKLEGFQDHEIKQVDCRRHNCLCNSVSIGCWYAAAAGAGAAGGYELKEEGYKVQSPVTKEKTKKDAKKESDNSAEE
ncbi:MAG: hypothetical protein ACLP9S_12485 [Syntrophales bacterium]|jgi:hypothetical protein